MLKFRITILSIFCSITLIAQNATIENIKKTNALHDTIKCDFTRYHHIIALNKIDTLQGNLHFLAPDYMHMHYTTPPTDLLLIKGNQFDMVQNGRKRSFNLEQNPRMRSLANLLLNSMMGDIAIIEQETATKATYSFDNHNHIFTFSSNNHSAKGYRQVVLKYSKTTHLLTYMKLEEFSGNCDIYLLSSHIF